MSAAGLAAADDRHRGGVGTLLALALALRLVAILLLKPGGTLIDSIGDFGFYRGLAELALLGRRPFLDYWVEYPPLFPWVLLGLYRLSLALPGWPSTTAPFTVTLGLFLALCDAVNVALVWRIASRLSGPFVGGRAAAIYAFQPFVLVAGLAWFDAFPLVFLLGALEAALAGRAGLAGATLGLGALAKIVPLAVAPAVVALLHRPARLARAAIGGGLVLAAGIVPLALVGGPYPLASLRAILNRSSWETVWAFVEGYWRVGTVAPLGERTLIEAAGRPLHPATLPWTAIGLLQIALILLLCLVPGVRAEPRRAVAVGLLGLLATLLLNRGYSPQFLVYLLPLIILLWPTRRGLAYTLGLTLLGFLEWPIVLSLFPDRHDLIATVIGARTIVWLLLAVDALAVLWPVRLALWRRWTPAIGGVGLAVGAIGLVWLTLAMLAALPARGEQTPVVAHIRAIGGDGPIVASSRGAFYRLVPIFGADRVRLGVDGLAPSADAALAQLRGGLTGETAWLVLDQSEGDQAWRDRLAAELGAIGSPATDRWLGYYHLLGFIDPERWRRAHEPRRIDAQFGDVLRLEGWLPIESAVARGAPYRVVLSWRVLAAPTVELKAFLHLLDPTTEQIVSQDDRPLVWSGRTSRAWRADETPLTALEPVVPPEAALGPLTLRLGVYDPVTGRRLPVGATDHIDLPGPTVRP